MNDEFAKYDEMDLRQLLQHRDTLQQEINYINALLPKGRDLWLLSWPENRKIEVVKAVRAASGRGLVESARLIESALPVCVMRYANPEDNGVRWLREVATTEWR